MFKVNKKNPERFELRRFGIFIINMFSLTYFPPFYRVGYC